MILDKFRLDGKIGIVTGASRGIGRAIAIGLAQAGADLVLVGRVQETLEQAKTDVLSSGKRVLAIVGDASVEGDILRIVDQTVGTFGKIDILVNAAGITSRSPAEGFSVADWDRVINVNLRGIYLVCTAVGREMIKRERGKIINIASLATHIGIPNASAYVASKGGVGQYTKVLAVEWAKYNIQVNGIAPGYIETEMTKPLKQDAHRVGQIMDRTPARRWGKPEDLAGAALFLASDASAFVTGHILNVDGGWMAA